MRTVYLGHKLGFHRAQGVTPPPAPSTPALVYPVFGIADPNGEPLIVKADLPDYGADVQPLREIHLVYMTESTIGLTPEQLISADGLMRCSIDVSNLKAQAVDISFPGLPDGAIEIQTVLVAGAD